MKIRALLVPLALPLALVLAACPKDKPAKADSAALAQPPIDSAALRDTTPTDLSQVQSNLPAAVTDTFTPPKVPKPYRAPAQAGSSIPSAPAALMAAVQREQSFSKFCYQEFGQKSDPSLRGGVAMVVGIGAEGLTSASVGNSNWSSNAGQAVNRCLNDRAKLAWKVDPGAVKPGKYVVQLSFSGT